MKLIRSYLLIILPLVVSGCFQINTDNPQKAFKYWTRAPIANSEVEVLNGKYWQSGHFTLEYEAYLLLKASKNWRDELIEKNNLIIDTTEWYCPKDVPSWFLPPSDYTLYKSLNNSQFHIWVQQKGDTVYIYDLQL